MPARILIIDDNPANLELARYLLEAHGYTVLMAADGENGLRIARQENPHLILCDLNMPRLDGHGVLAEIRSDPALRGTPVIAATASSGSEERKILLASGFDGYIAKPIDAEFFVVEVEGFLAPDLRGVAPSRET